MSDQTTISADENNIFLPWIFYFSKIKNKNKFLKQLQTGKVENHEHYNTAFVNGNSGIQGQAKQNIPKPKIIVIEITTYVYT